MAKFKPSTRIDQFACSSFLTEFMNTGFRSPQLLAAAIKEDLYHPDVLPIADRLMQCRKHNKCRMSICPTCGRTHNKRTAIQIVRNIVGHIGAGQGMVGQIKLDMDHLSYVTINGDPLASIDEAEIVAQREGFRKKHQNTRRRHLLSTALSGQMEVGLGETSHLHVHALIHHPNHSRKELSDTLKASFKEARAVMVSEWKLSSELKEKHLRKMEENSWRLDDFNVANTARYMGKYLPWIPHTVESRNGKLVKVATRETAKLLGKWLLQMFHLRGDKLKSSRVTTGIRKPKGWTWTRAELVKKDSNKVVVAAHYCSIIDVIRERKDLTHTDEIERREMRAAITVELEELNRQRKLAIDRLKERVRTRTITDEVYVYPEDSITDEIDIVADFMKSDSDSMEDVYEDDSETVYDVVVVVGDDW